MTDNTDISEQDKLLFRQAVGKTDPIRHDQTASGRKTIHQTRQRPIRNDQPRQTGAASSANKAPRMLEVGDELSFRRPGIQQKQFRKLRRGQYPVEATADLHGETVMEARKYLDAFLQSCRGNDYRCVLIIHGKGHGSRDRKPVIKNKLNEWLREYEQVLAFCSARVTDGGTGAAYVLLRNTEL